MKTSTVWSSGRSVRGRQLLRYRPARSRLGCYIRLEYLPVEKVDYLPVHYSGQYVGGQCLQLVGGLYAPLLGAAVSRASSSPYAPTAPNE